MHERPARARIRRICVYFSVVRSSPLRLAGVVRSQLRTSRNSNHTNLSICSHIQHVEITPWMVSLSPLSETAEGRPGGVARRLFRVLDRRKRRILLVRSGLEQAAGQGVGRAARRSRGAECKGLRFRKLGRESAEGRLVVVVAVDAAAKGAWPDPVVCPDPVPFLLRTEDLAARQTDRRRPTPTETLDDTTTHACSHIAIGRQPRSSLFTVFGPHELRAPRFSALRTRERERGRGRFLSQSRARNRDPDRIRIRPRQRIFTHPKPAPRVEDPEISDFLFRPNRAHKTCMRTPTSPWQICACVGQGCLRVGMNSGSSYIKCRLVGVEK